MSKQQGNKKNSFSKKKTTKFFITLAIVLFLSLGFIPTIHAEPTQTQITNTTNSTIHLVTTKNYTLSYQGTTQDNRHQKAKTKKWSVLYGNITATILLGDGTSLLFKTWDVLDITGAILYATTGTINNWTTGNIKAGNASQQEAFLTRKAADNYTNTFNKNETFTTQKYNIANTPYATTQMNNATSTLWKTYSLYAENETSTIWATKAHHNTSSFKGTKVDYQLIVPAWKTKTYRLYLEIE